MNAGHPVGGSPVGSPVAHYKLDEGYGASSQDAFQNNQDLTLVNTPAWSNTAKFGRALDLERDSSEYGYTADSSALSITSDLTITGWIKPESVTSSTLFDIAGKWDDSNESYLLALYGDELRMYIDSSSNYKTTSAANLAAGTMYHVAGVYSASSQTMTLYVNGVEQSGSTTGTIPSSIGDDGGRFHLGAEDSSSSATNFFDGIIDEVKIYNSALTPDQIALDMNQGKSVQFGGQTSATGAIGQAAEYCVPGDTSQCDPPVGEWKFDEKTGGTVNDTSGNGNIGTWYGSGSHWTRGKYGSAGSFNGSDDYVSTTSSFNNPQDFTIQAWFKTLSASGKKIVGFENQQTGTGSSTYDRHLYIDTNGNVRFGCYNGGFYYANSNSTYNDNQWHFAVATHSSSDNVGKLYIDGIYQSSFTSACQNFTGYWRMGNYRLNGWSNASDGYFPGLIDQVRIFNYARTPAQIAWDYNRGKPVGWWKFDEGEGAAAYDSSGNGNNGTLTNMDPPNDWVDGKFGKALDFDGSNDYVATGNVALIAANYKTYNSVSWGAWVKPSSSIASKTIIHKNNEFRLTTDADGKASCSIYSGSWQTAAVSSSALSLGDWSHVMCKYDGTSIKIYINGEEKGTQSEADNITSISSTALNIGRDSAGSGYFQGQIDDVRIYNYALTEEQVGQVMNEGAAIRFGE